jgi:hypothetical protein
MHSMTIGFGPTTADGYTYTNPWGSATLPSANASWPGQIDSFTLTLNGVTIVGSGDTYYAGVDGITIATSLVFTWAGKAALVGINEVDVTFAAAAASPGAGTLTGSVGSTGLSFNVSAAGTVSQTLGSPVNGVLTLGPTPSGWQITSITIKYTTQYVDGSTA